MKKHELLEKAMRDYPAGTKFANLVTNGKILSTGRFSITRNGVIHDPEMNTNGDYVYSWVKTYDWSGKWAEIVKDEPLKVEKIAVKVNNEREKKTINDWMGFEFAVKANGYGYPIFIKAYNNGFFASKHDAERLDYTIVDFDFFCAQKGIEAPKPILKSEDGVDLYEGDRLFEANRNLNGSWYITSGESGRGYWTVKNRADKWSLGAPEGYESKAFSTKEAAEKWVENKNKPKYKAVALFSGMEAHVYRGEILVKDADRVVTTLYPSDIEDMDHALKVLQKNQ